MPDWYLLWDLRMGLKPGGNCGHRVLQGLRGGVSRDSASFAKIPTLGSEVPGISKANLCSSKLLDTCVST